MKLYIILFFYRLIFVNPIRHNYVFLLILISWL